MAGLSKQHRMDGQTVNSMLDRWRLTDDFASGAARIDEPLTSTELWREAAADEGMQNAVTTVGHH